MSVAPKNAIQVWPARLVLADGTTHATARVDTTRSGLVRAWVMLAPTAGAKPLPTLVASWPADDLTQPERRRWVAADGAVIERKGGCGCSHPLGRFRPPAEAA